MRAFQHRNAAQIEEAVALLRASEGPARIIAGGTDLLGQMNDEILPTYPKTVVNLKTVAELDYIVEDDTSLRIGALARLADIARDGRVRGRYGALAQAAGNVASPTIREMATIAGNICQSTRCWYYWNPDDRFECMRKGGQTCYAITGEGRYHSIFGGVRVASPPCTEQCPSGVDIPSYLSLVRQGDLAGAAAILLEKNPLPAITGRVCPHVCEQECNRGDYDDAVSIRDVERSLGDYILDHADELLPPAFETGRRVAVVGSGPAGLSAAFYLRRKGDAVVVFEKFAEPGGMLRYAIPSYRLPLEVLRRELALLEALGVEFRCGVEVGVDIGLDELRREYDGVFLAAGAWGQPGLGLAHEELLDSGLEFLTAVREGLRDNPGEKVVVIGGGNVAVDVALAARRLGSADVSMVCLECDEEMPALTWEVEQARAEGVAVYPSWGPASIMVEDGRLTGLELVRCTCVFDENKRFNPAFDENCRETITADRVFLAIGQKAELEALDPEGALRGRGRYLTVDECTQATSLARVYAGGDAASGPATVTAAFAAGRRAAGSLHAALSPETSPEAPAAASGAGACSARLVGVEFNEACLARSERTAMPELPIAQRNIQTEDALGLPAGTETREAARCFNCSCMAVNNSDVAPALVALDAKIRTTKRTVDAGDFFAAGVDSTTILDKDEIVLEIEVPVPPAGARSSFVKFAPRKSIDFPVVSCAAMVHPSREVRVCLNAVHNLPRRARAAEEAMAGKEISVANAEAAGSAAVIGATALPKSGYKAQVAKALVKRALLACK